MKNLVITAELEKKGKHGTPSDKALFWFWKDEIGNIGFLRAITEMEALDRLRDCFPEAGRITWITSSNYLESIFIEA
ncbi:hypothetical protein [Epilithonimonas mollis]|nr:hypothetical protein [Epilithonimonas mollis]